MIQLGIRKRLSGIKRLARCFRVCPTEEKLKAGNSGRRKKQGRMLKSFCSKIRLCFAKIKLNSGSLNGQSEFCCCWEPLVTSYSLRFGDVEVSNNPVADLTSSSTRDTQCTQPDSLHLRDSLVASFRCNEFSSQENGICQNCQRTFRRRWSHFQEFCNLDCKTAFRLRHSATSPSIYSSIDLSFSYSYAILQSF
uniref:AlNc14C226G9211 protein n=1 Tax=Albugo laibachii Nc14 TaxID=890382 RepID=F0WS73_9STRA|nr:AlNc14C226G9211 [Albugo laibachii Nc14]|eukprot:CCA24191.1 AlNc14C226G9211 [Albugo laibachii Nc14]